MDVTLEEWIKRIGHKPVPVLSKTISELRYHCARDNAPVADLLDVVERDPGLVVHLLRLGNAKTAGPLRTDINSVKDALMILGTEQVSELPQRLPPLDETLYELASTRLQKTFSRAYHAARQATAWAVMRRDMAPDEVFAATQLHFLGEMFISIYVPELLDQVDHMRNERKIASEEAQYLVLGFTLDQLTAKLARLWKLPSLLLEALHPENAKFPRAYGIMLAVQLARGAAVDWYGEKTHAIQEQAAKWLDMEIDSIIAGTHRLAVDVAHDSELYKVPPAVMKLAPIYVQHKAKQVAETSTEIDSNEANVCLMPQINTLKGLLSSLSHSQLPVENAYALVSYILKGMHDGVGLNRVVFASLDKDNNRLRAEKIIGADNDPLFSRFEISLNLPHLFARLLEKPQAILINDQNRKTFWSLVPVEFQKLVGTNSFIAMSVCVKGKPLGLFYADRHNSACQVDEKSYNYFKTICKYASEALQRLPVIDFRHT